jgi:hypothetical protein
MTVAIEAANTWLSDRTAPECCEASPMAGSLSRSPLFPLAGTVAEETSVYVLTERRRI